MVRLKIVGQKMHMILIDNGSSIHVLFSSTLDRMNLVGHTSTPVHMPLYGFLGENIHIEGELDLPVELGDTPYQYIQFVKFLVVNCPLIYNMIIGQPTFNAIRAVASTYHLLVMFPTVGNIGVLKG